MPRFGRADAGGVRLTLDDQEAAILRQVAREMHELLAEGRNPNDAVSDRLFPQAYQADEDEAAYRELVGDDLVRHKVRAVRTVEASVGDRGGADIELDAEGVELWLGFLTDVRLAIGVRLEVDEDMMSRPLKPDDRNAPALSLMHWLGYMQEGIIQQVS